MNNLVLRLSLAAAVTLVGFALTSSSQTYIDRNPSTAVSLQEFTAAQSQPQSGSQMPTANDTQTQDAHTFTGRVAEENGRLVLRDPVTKVSYQFDDPSKAKHYVGKEVKVTGKLDLDSNTIYIESIEPLS